MLTLDSPAEAISWVTEQGSFANSSAADNAYNQLKAETKPRNARGMDIVLSDLWES